MGAAVLVDKFPLAINKKRRLAVIGIEISALYTRIFVFAHNCYWNRAINVVGCEAQGN